MTSRDPLEAASWFLTAVGLVALALFALAVEGLICLSHCGARDCLFSTGTFIERIEAWEVNKRLAFSVIEKADAMRELSPYNIHPRHLDGYFNPERAEFTLIANSDGSTTLEGKSWYRNSMWPGVYWRLWSDKILHDVHTSVFEHVKKFSESAYNTR